MRRGGLFPGRLRGLAGLLLLVALLVGSVPGGAQAQETPSTKAADADSRPEAVSPLARTAATEISLLAGPVDAAVYHLGPGDLLQLEFSGRAARVTPIPVDAEGRAGFPEMGVIAVGGRTLGDVRTQVLGRLRPLYPGVRIDLRLVRVRTFKVYVAGQVKTPGVAEATAATRASEVLAGRLSLLPEASRRNIELRRRDGTALRVDLDAFAFLGQAANNPYLEDGDVLVVPTRIERLYAYGAFARSGEYERAPGDRISDLRALAGGLLPGVDAKSGILVRFVTPAQLDTVPVDLALAAGSADDLLLEDADRVFARELTDYKRGRNVTVLGEVRQPGPYAIREGEDRLGSILDRAGGLTPTAASDRIQIFRPAEGSGQQDVEFDRLSRLARSEMTDAEYQTFKTKLASRQAAYIVDYDVLKGAPASSFDVPLKDRDVILVDRATQAVRVAGEVQRPSLIEFQAGRPGKDYITLAGGFTRQAQRGKVRLTRAGSNQTIYLEEAGAVHAGDFIWVPEKREVNFWGVVKDVILVAGSVATIGILVNNSTK